MVFLLSVASRRIVCILIRVQCFHQGGHFTAVADGATLCVLLLSCHWISSHRLLARGEPVDLVFGSLLIHTIRFALVVALVSVIRSSRESIL